MSYEGLKGTEDKENPHVGGNVTVGDPFTFCPNVWNYLIERFCLRSVLDLGSGRGYSARYFNQKGLDVLAVDGMRENCLKAVYPTLHVDLTQTQVFTNVDLVHCQEVVEHIEEKYLSNLLGSMSSGKFILMTNALPGQGGHHHVNEQPTDYWVNKLMSYGYKVLVEDTNRIRTIAASEGAKYLAQTGLVLARESD